MFQPPDIKIIGPSRYCPDCGRVLLEMNQEEETFVVSKKTQCVLQGSLTVHDLDEMPEEIEAVPDMYCLRWHCRFKRWRRGEKISEAPWEEDEVLAELRKFKWAAYVLAGALIFFGLAYFADIIIRILE